MHSNRPPTFNIILATTWVVVAACGCRGPGEETDRATDEASAATASNESSDMARTKTDPSAAAASLNGWSDAMDEVTALIAQGQFDAARERTEAAIADQPESGKWHFLHALSYHRALQYERARPGFERAIALDPDFPHTYHFYGYCMYYLGDLDAAEAAFRRHLEFTPEEGDSHFGLGLVHFDRDELEEAEAAFWRAIELQQGNRGRGLEVAKSYIRLSDVFARRNELEEAREALERAIAIVPQHVEAYLKLSRILTRLDETEGAAEAQARYEQLRDAFEQQSGDVPPDDAPTGDADG